MLQLCKRGVNPLELMFEIKNIDVDCVEVLTARTACSRPLRFTTIVRSQSPGNGRGLLLHMVRDGARAVRGGPRTGSNCQTERRVDLTPWDSFGKWVLAAVCHRAGDRERIRELAEKLAGSDSRALGAAMYYAATGEADTMFEALDAAYRLRDSALTGFLYSGPFFDPYRADPRWQALPRRMPLATTMSVSLLSSPKPKKGSRPRRGLLFITFQDHLVLETESDFRIIIGLENARPAIRSPGVRRAHRPRDEDALQAPPAEAAAERR